MAEACNTEHADMPEPVLLFDVMGTLVHDPFECEIPGFFDLTREELVRRQHPTNWIEFEVSL